MKITNTENKYEQFWHRAVSALAIAVISFVGMESLVYVNNLYQPQIYLKLSGFIFLILIIWLQFIFDLHFKGVFPDAASMWHGIKSRFHYFGKWSHFRHFLNYLILPGIIYWGSVILIGINFGEYKLQQYIAIVSAIALVAAFTLFKEVFHTKVMPIGSPQFLILSYVKLYAAWLIYSASLGIVWFYCFPQQIFYWVIFLVTFMLLYQALFQFSGINFRHIFFAFVISVLVGFGSYFVYQFWNVNYFSAGLFLVAIYNLLWGMLFHSINKTLSKEVVFEQLAIFALIVVMVFGVTNFHARITRCA